MDKLTGLQAFVKTVDTGSFVAASRVLEISASAVGKAVARLEHDLGVRLLQRSTRKVQLTEEGRAFHERCKRILDDLEEAHTLLQHSRAVPSGRLRVSAPIVGYHFLMPLVSDFLARYPAVELDINYTDRTVDVIEDRIDVAIRSGDLPDSRLVSVPLQTFTLGLWASPDYLAHWGQPQDIQDLIRHRSVRFRHPDTGKLLDWPVLDPAAGVSLPPLKTVLACNNMEAVLDAALRGLGIACMPDFWALGARAQGGLVQVLAPHCGAHGQFKALWPSGRHVPSKVRVFVDHLREHLVPRPPSGRRAL
ncbi:MAG TPA: LysR substrate-binding domain-containing protein [Burkholderiaceae bacterium]|nr:LysR substrate-binding domain-containing protein [Burkholderiaceae bacterium]